MTQPIYCGQVPPLSLKRSRSFLLLARYSRIPDLIIRLLIGFDWDGEGIWECIFSSKSSWCWRGVCPNPNLPLGTGWGAFWCCSSPWPRKEGRIVLRERLQQKPRTRRWWFKLFLFFQCRCGSYSPRSSRCTPRCWVEVALFPSPFRRQLLSVGASHRRRTIRWIRAALGWDWNNYSRVFVIGWGWWWFGPTGVDLDRKGTTSEDGEGVFR